MQMCLGPQVDPLRRDETPPAIFEIHSARWAVAFGLVSRPASPRLIHHVHRITLSQEKLRPAFTPIRSSREIGSRLASAVDHHDRPRMALLGRNLKLAVHLSAHSLPVPRRRVFSPNE